MAQKISQLSDLEGKSGIFFIHPDYLYVKSWPEEIVKTFEKTIQELNTDIPIVNVYFQDKSYLSGFTDVALDVKGTVNTPPFADRIYIAGAKITMCLYNEVQNLLPFVDELVYIDDLSMEIEPPENNQACYSKYYARKFAALFPEKNVGVCISQNLDEILFYDPLQSFINHGVPYRQPGVYFDELKDPNRHISDVRANKTREQRMGDIWNKLVPAQRKIMLFDSGMSVALIGEGKRYDTSVEWEEDLVGIGARQRHAVTNYCLRMFEDPNKT